MWYWLTRFESLLFYFPFLVYASVRHIPYSIKCRKCGRWLFFWDDCYWGLCERCSGQQAAIEPEQLWESAYSKSLTNTQSSTAEYIYAATAKRAGFGKVLEIGCGKGHLLFRLQSPHRQLSAMDISPAAIQIAKARTPQARFGVADAKKLPFKSNTFDYVIATEVLEHMEGDQTIKECFRVLKVGGSALFTVPNGKGIGGTAAGHVRFFTFASFLEYVRQAGFEISLARKIGLYIPVLTYSIGLVARTTNKNIPLSGPLNIGVPEFLSVNFLIECRKPPI